MSAEPLPPIEIHSSIVSRPVGSWEKFFLWLSAVLVSIVGALLVLFEVKMGPRQRHFAQLERVGEWIRVARAFPPPGMNQPEWSQCLVAPYNSLYNVLDNEKRVPTERVRELADHLDRTEAAQLSTMGGLMGFIDYVGEVRPTARDYGPFEFLRINYPRVKPVPLVMDRKTK